MVDSPGLRRRGAWLVAAVFAAVPALAAKPLPEDLSGMSLESLMDIEVTSVSKRPEKRSESAAAIYVITPEQIRRWGVTNIPDALRMVPGLHVARIDGNKWAITARGFNSRFANKLLVLLDGRSIYTPLFAGVYWDMHDVPLEDIERIEVIRGPGGTLWGANAVNGVINIITRPAAETQGGLLSLTAGSEERLITTARHGGRLGPNAHYRVYAKHRHRDEGHGAPRPRDDWRLGQGGFRLDWEGVDDALTLQGDYYDGESGQRVTVPVDPAPAVRVVGEAVELGGANLLARWSRDLGGGDGLTVQGYWDHVSRDGPVLYEDRDIFDLELQHDLSLAAGRRLIWGLGYRRTSDDTDPNPYFRLRPSSRTVDLFSAFAQVEAELVPEELILTVGTKLEHNDFTGFEYQPNVRLAWLPGGDHTVWGAVSRAVRTPARGEHDVRLRVLPMAPPRGVPWVVQGDEDFQSEILVAYELGWRWQSTPRLSLDVAAFYNDYDELRTFDAEVFPPPVLGFPFDNRLEGSSHGLEAVVRWRATPDWRLEAGYSWLGMDLERVQGSRDTLSEGAEDASPRHQLSAWSFYTLAPGLELDAALRYVDDIETPAGPVDGYVGLDLRLGWALSRDMELSLAGRNLLEDHHREFLPDFIQTQGTEVERSVHLALKWRF